MKFDRIFRLLHTCIIVIGSVVFAALAPAAAQAYGFPVTFTCPTFPPLDEITLQAAMAEGDAVTVDPLLNARLRGIDIRTALEDTERLHNDRG